MYEAIGSVFEIKPEQCIKAKRGREITFSLSVSTSTTFNTAYDALSPYMPENKEIIMTGAYGTAPISSGIKISNTIRIYYGGSLSILITDGSSTTFGAFGKFVL